jgi:hypothetical protein
MSLRRRCGNAFGGHWFGADPDGSGRLVFTAVNLYLQPMIRAGIIFLAVF